jgi:hypothetical protein
MTSSIEPSSAPPGELTAPDFFVVGHAKSGTSALYEMLRRHPEIYMPDQKEPWFFASELLLREDPRAFDGLPATFEDYLALFAGAKSGQRTGEASPSYIWSHKAARRIADVRPDARIIVILREPADFLRSLHLQLVQFQIETESDFATALALEGTRREGRAVPRSPYSARLFLYSEHVRYVEQLRRYHAAFPTRQVLVLIYDDFRQSNEATARTVMRFIGVDDAVPIEQIEANVTRRARFQQLDRLGHTLAVGRGPVARASRATVKAVTSRGLRHGALRLSRRSVIHSKPPPPDAELMLDLRRRFKPEVESLSEYLGRDLVALWGYDRLNARDSGPRQR